MPQDIKIKKEMPISPEREIIPEREVEEKPEIISEEKKEEIVEKPIIKEEIVKEAKEIKALDKENQVKTLCDLALQKGLDYSIKVARSLNNAYVLDEFHDTLIDKLREQLIKKGKLKNAK